MSKIQMLYQGDTYELKEREPKKGDLIFITQIGFENCFAVRRVSSILDFDHRGIIAEFEEPVNESNEVSLKFAGDVFSVLCPVNN